MKDERTVETERIDDLPVLIEWLKQMKVDAIIDDHTHAHGLWGGISKGLLGLTWIAHMIMTGDHRQVRLNELLQRNRRSLGVLLGNEIRESEFNDDRLGRLLTDLGRGETAEAIEREMNAQCIRCYRLPTEQATVRLDTTSVAVHGDDDGSGVIAYGYSKDQRPDLRQFKVLRATLDPLGMPLLTQLVAGNRSDDGCYVPAYEEAIKSTGKDIMVIGDSKMSALATRAHLHSGGSRYITPLAMVGKTKEDMAQWVDAAVAGTVALTRVRAASAEAIGRGYEVVREQMYRDEDRAVTVTWQERVLVMQSEEYARSQEAGLRQRLTTARTSLTALTARKGKGHRRYTTAAALHAACQSILEKHAVVGLLTVTLECERQTRTVNAHRGRPSQHTPHPPQRLIEEVSYKVSHLHLDSPALAARIARLGWRAYATNAEAKEWSLNAVVLAYRGEWRIEQGFHLLKGSPLSLAPVYLTKTEHIRGLLCLLSLAVRALTLIRYTVSQSLQQADETLKGISPAYPHVKTNSPSAAMILAAFASITLAFVQHADQYFVHVSPLTHRQCRLLALLHLPADLYQRIADILSTHPPFFSEA
ncbi:MAG: IS1634 family transposase [Candidatus Binatia bacterium]